MRVSDFILETRSDLQEKTQQWKDEELLIKLKKAYVKFQEDLPFFIDEMNLDIKKGIKEYYPRFDPYKPVSLQIDSEPYEWMTYESLYRNGLNNAYTFYANKLTLKVQPLRDAQAHLVYKYISRIEAQSCYIELPIEYHTALRQRFLKEIHEKPTRNTKERNLSLYYLKEYQRELYDLKVKNKTIQKKVTSNYQRI